MNAIPRTLDQIWKQRRAVLAYSLLIAATVAGVNFWMIRSASPLTFREAATVPANQVCLVLGTGPTMANGSANLHFTTRMNAAAQLYHAGKVHQFLLSGDNSKPTYDEPTAMKEALLRKGVPETAMTLDYAGFRTLDSMARARTVFGQGKLTIVTEEFHAPRSVFLARHFGLDPVVFCAKDPPWKWTLRASAREVGARVKAALDIFVLHRGPKFLGEKIKLA